MKPKILAFPKDQNPYQELLYAPLRSMVDIEYLKNPTPSQTLGILLLPFQLVLYRIKGFNIFHLHFFYLFTSPINHWFFNNIFTKTLYTFYFIFFLLWIKLLQYKLVWTVHNLLWDESQFINDRWILKILSYLADLKIIHSKITLANMNKIGLDTNNCQVIPHGNYTNIYPNTLNKEKVRTKLEIDNNSFVFCYFGIIDSYKGVPNLLKSFIKLKADNSVLLISGKCNDPTLRKNILKYAKYRNIRLRLEYIPDEDVQIYLNSADVMVFPHQVITTSGSIILGLTFYKPVIFPRLGNLTELPSNIGFPYDPSDKQGLLNSMNMAITNKHRLKEISKNVKNYVDTLSWDKIADTTYEAYKNLLK